MNSISLNNISKKFSGQWIFKNISFEAKQGDAIAITGYNGAGKSTLLQIIAGYMAPTSGTTVCFFKGLKVTTDDLYKYITFSAPYLKLIEEFTLKEIIVFYSKFKSLSNNLTASMIIETAELSASFDKQIKFFSSGMKQRVKLALALMTDVPFVLLDEPLSNLDQHGYEWYRTMIAQYKTDKILFVSSNRLKEETEFCNKLLNIQDFNQN